MAEEASCPDNSIFDSRLQTCNWKEDPYGADCEELLLFQNNATCLCEYAETQCARSLQGLMAATISAWVFPDDCVMTNAVYSIGDVLFQNHKSNVCAECILPACGAKGNPLSQSYMDQATH